MCAYLRRQKKVMNIEIRAATQADTTAIWQLVRELAIYELSPESHTATPEDYARDMEAGNFEAHVAIADGEVVGMILYHIAYSTWRGRMLYLEDFVVRDTMRGQGIGKLLFDKFLEIAEQKDCKLTKWQVLDWNEPAVNFYEKYNAIIEKEWWNGKLFV